MGGGCGRMPQTEIGCPYGAVPGSGPSGSGGCRPWYSRESKLALAHSWQFLRRYLQDPKSVGAIAPSSRALAAALCDPFRRAVGPVTVLEVGAGTGAVTRHLGGLLDSGDALDICEPDPKFTKILERDVLTREPLAAAVARGRVRLLRQPVQMLSERRRYDYVIAGLPFTAFTLSDLRDVFAAIRGVLKPGGVLSYFEYAGLRKTSRVLSIGRKRTRVRSVSAYLAQNIRDFQFDRKTVLRNLPPAYVRHLRFEPAQAAQGRPNQPD